MLAIYNESKTNWLRANITDRTSKITTSRTSKDGRVSYLDILVSNDINTSDITSSVNMSENDNCITLYRGNTSVKFKSKDLKPLITTSDKYNTDIICINISLKGRLIKNMSNENSVLAFLIAQGELFLVVAMNDKSESVKFDIELHDPHVVADTTYTFEKVGGTYKVSTSMAQTDAVISKPTYKITRFRPARPTNLIFVNDSDMDALKSNLRYPDSHKILSVIDSDVSDMIAYIEPLKKSGYKAATLFVNTDNFSGSDDEQYGAEYDTLKTNFKFVNILLNNGKVLRK